MRAIKPVLYLVSLLSFTTIHADIQSHFNHIKDKPDALYTFFRAMPKGGELHYHLAGGSYAENMLAIAAQGNYCLNKNTYSIQKNTGACDGVTAKELFNDPTFYDKTIRAWSMKDFTPGVETGHDHFFAAFSMFMPLITDVQPALIADVIRMAANQNEQYMELMIMSDNGNALGFGKMIKDTPSLDQKRQLLLANKEYQKNIDLAVSEAEQLIQKARQILGCERHPEAEECAITIKFLSYSLREQPLDNVFAQTLHAFESVARSQKNGGALVGVNLVQAEDGIISLRDYHQQMKIYQYLHQLYPQVHISLHAGELTPGQVAPQDLNDHIHEALVTGQAQRIGHGVNIAYEHNALDTVAHMAKQHKPIEINLISNKLILNISGNQHPLNYYRAHHVPVVLSTDDEGVLRTDLAAQYVEAALVHGVDYPAIKQINRNALTYSFAPGQSIWADADHAVLVPECQDLHSARCTNFIKRHEKARLQWNLEQKLDEFEKGFTVK